MTLFFLLKIWHVIGAAVLFGTGMGSALYMFIANRSGNLEVIYQASAKVVIADWLFTGTSGVLQPITGFWMVYLKGYDPWSLWVIGSVSGYIIAGLFWLPVVYFQIRLRNLAKSAIEKGQPLCAQYHKLYRLWFAFGWPAFIALVIVFYLMANKPLTG